MIDIPTALTLVVIALLVSELARSVRKKPARSAARRPNGQRLCVSRMM
jgi:hypothetical protein